MTGFDWVLLGFPVFYWVLLGFTGFYWVSLGFTGFHWVSLGFIGFYWVLLGFTGFYWVFRYMMADSGSSGGQTVQLSLGLGFSAFPRNILF